MSLVDGSITEKIKNALVNLVSAYGIMSHSLQAPTEIAETDLGKAIEFNNGLNGSGTFYSTKPLAEVEKRLLYLSNVC